MALRTLQGEHGSPCFPVPGGSWRPSLTPSHQHLRGRGQGRSPLPHFSFTAFQVALCLRVEGCFWIDWQHSWYFLNSDKHVEVHWSPFFSFHYEVVKCCTFFHLYVSRNPVLTARDPQWSGPCAHLLLSPGLPRDGEDLRVPLPVLWWPLGSACECFSRVKAQYWRGQQPRKTQVLSTTQNVHAHADAQKKLFLF